MKAAELGQEAVLPPVVERGGDERGDGRVVAGMGIDPTGGDLRLSRRLFHVRLHPPRQLDAFLLFRRRQRPDAHQALIEQPLVVAIGRRLAVHLAAAAAIDARPGVQRRPPTVRNLGEHADSRPRVFAPLRVVRAGAGKRAGPAGLPGDVLAMKFLNRRRAAAGVAAHLVQRKQGAIAVKRRVLDPLGHHGTGRLLEAADEQLPLAAAGLVQRRRNLQQQHVADEVEQGGVHRRVATLGLRPARQTNCRSRSATCPSRMYVR